ncbi:MAG: response regulator transcription factor [Anaerolineales bacterium]|nr:response regulator transcription factor [Anaerolineales bacterium]
MKAVIIEDQAETVEAISMCFELRWPDATVLSTGKGNKGLELIEAELPDIVTLDLELPDIDGFELLRQVRRSFDMPIIIVTVRNQKMDIVKGLELGADDYITKPFDHIEFLARVKAVLRRTSMPQLRKNAEPFQSGKLRIDFDSREVSLGGKKVTLTPIEYNLLHYLAKNAGHIMPHHALLEKVWGTEYTNATDYLKVYVQRLRAKLCDNLSVPQLILTERRVGYKLVKSG